jgi:hypothetical protein
MKDWFCPGCGGKLTKLEKDYSPENSSLLENLIVIKKELFKKIKTKITDDYSEKYKCTNDKCSAYNLDLSIFDPTVGYKSMPSDSWAIGWVK